MYTLIIISVLVTFIYVLFISVLVNGWMKIDLFKENGNQHKTFCSIIIAARNEAGNIENILSDILLQETDRSLIEIIVVNDHSEDQTANVVSFFQQNQSVILLNLPDDLHGKKQALAHGIAKATGELIITIDADCRVGKHWLGSIMSFYETHSPHLIIGPVDYIAQKGFWQKMQNIEFLSLVGTSAAATGNGQSFLCNGANLIFPRSVYTQINDPFNNSVSSGDDVFLLHNIKKRPDAKIMFLKSPQAIVYTEGSKTIKEFVSQKVRWASKSKLMSDTESLSFILIISAINIHLGFLLILGLFFTKVLFLFMGVYIIKMIVDTTFFKQILPFFSKSSLLKLTIVANFLYFFYYITMIILSLSYKPKWKNRTIKV